MSISRTDSVQDINGGKRNLVYKSDFTEFHPFSPMNLKYSNNFAASYQTPISPLVQNYIARSPQYDASARSINQTSDPHQNYAGIRPASQGLQYQDSQSRIISKTRSPSITGMHQIMGEAATGHYERLMANKIKGFNSKI